MGKEKTNMVILGAWEGDFVPACSFTLGDFRELVEYLRDQPSTTNPIPMRLIDPGFFPESDDFPVPSKVPNYMGMRSESFTGRTLYPMTPDECYSPWKAGTSVYLKFGERIDRCRHLDAYIDKVDKDGNVFITYRMDGKLYEIDFTPREAMVRLVKKNTKAPFLPPRKESPIYRTNAEISRDQILMYLLEKGIITLKTCYETIADKSMTIKKIGEKYSEHLK